MYSRYFSSGQKLQVQTLRNDNLPTRRESINALFANYELGYFDITLPQDWPVSDDSFSAGGAPWKSFREKYGLWLKSTASFHSQPADKLIRLRMNNDLCLFRHRPKERVETRIGLRYSTPRGNLATSHRQWRQQIDKLTSTATALTVPSFARGQVNLSASGIRMSLQDPIKKNDLCLLMLALDEASEPICTLSEIIWTAPNDQGNGTKAGMQFLNILEKDKQRIEQFVKQNMPRKDPERP